MNYAWVIIIIPDMETPGVFGVLYMLSESTLEADRCGVLAVKDVHWYIICVTDFNETLSWYEILRLQYPHQ